MKKLLFTAIFATLLPVCTFAEQDERAPGVYAVVGDESIPIKFTRGVCTVWGENKMGVEYTYRTFRYDGVTSEVTAGDTLALVIDPKRKEIIKKMQEYNPFVKSMNPSKMMIIPLEVNDETKCREYNATKKMDNIQWQKSVKMKFAWTKLTDNSFAITVPDIEPGEYGIVFNIDALNGFEYTRIFCFTIK